MPRQKGERAKSNKNRSDKWEHLDFMFEEGQQPVPSELTPPDLVTITGLDDIKMPTPPKADPLQISIASPSASSLEATKKVDPTAQFKQLTEELKELDLQHAIHLKESAPLPVIKPVEIETDDEGSFKDAFAPSSDFVGQSVDEDIPLEVPIEVKSSLWQRWREKIGRTPSQEYQPTPEETADTIGKTLPLLRLRAALLPFLILPLLYLTLAETLPLPLSEDITLRLGLFFRPYRFYGFTAAMHLAVMALCYDVIADGIRQLITLRLRRSFAVTVANLASLAFIYQIFLTPAAQLPYRELRFVPLNIIAALSLMFSLWARLSEATARHQTLKVAASIEKPIVLFRKEAGYERHAIFGRITGNHDDFVQQIESRDQAAVVDSKLVPILSVLAVLFALIAAISNETPYLFLWWYSILTLAVAPFTIGLSFALPYRRVVRHLARFRACIAGWPGVAALAGDGVSALRDADLFPPGRVKITGMVPFNDHSPARAITYTASILRVSECNLSILTDELIRDMKMGDVIQSVSQFEFHEEGGFSGEIGSDRILVGSGSFMRRMGVSLPKKLPSRTAIYTAINMSLACSFPLEYTTSKDVRRSVRKLLRYNVPPVLVCRDFNITPRLLNQVMSGLGDHVDIPPTEQRLALSSPEHPLNIKLAALIERDSIATYTECIVSGIKLRSATRFNLLFHLLCSVGGLLLFFYFAFINSPQSLLPHIILLFFGIFLVPVWLASRIVTWH
ncbi:MAG: hypothetical protein FWE06_06190 [Oscillospiraceae bacterium]|nr:hypothetical protein [Oscillospiraceae bacterium]